MKPQYALMKRIAAGLIGALCILFIASSAKAGVSFCEPMQSGNRCFACDCDGGNCSQIMCEGGIPCVHCLSQGYPPATPSCYDFTYNVSSCSSTCTPGEFCGDPNDPCDQSICEIPDQPGFDGTSMTQIPKCVRRTGCGLPDTCGIKSRGAGGAPSAEEIGDPVALAGQLSLTHDSLVDFSIFLPQGSIDFTRTYVSSDGVLGGARTLKDIPTPFGMSPTSTGSQRWTHNFFSFVDARNLVDGGQPTWVVRTTEGTIQEFSPCGTGDCWGSANARLPFKNSRLHFSTSPFIHFEHINGGRVFIYGALLGDALYFLSEIRTPQGTVLAQISYGAPDVGCPSADAGVPYINGITLSSGLQLIPSYAELPNAHDGGYECVITGISATQNASSESLTSYTYQSGISGLLATATSLSAGGTIFTESFNYSGGFSVSRNGSVLVNHNKSDAGISSGSDPSGQYNIGNIGETCPWGTCCAWSHWWGDGYDSLRTREVDIVASQGNGSSTPSTLQQQYLWNTTKYGQTSYLSSISDSCDGGFECSAGTKMWLPRWAEAGGWNVCPATGYDIGAVVDKRGNATMSTRSTIDAGLESWQFRKGVAVTYLGGNGIGQYQPQETTALELNSHVYVITDGGRVDLQETQPSTINLGQYAITTYVHDAENKLLRTEKSGWTMALDGGVIARTIKTFYSYDAAGRVTFVDGPCETTSTTACSTDAPGTTYSYYSTGYGFSSGRLNTVSRRGSGTVTYSNYTALGDAQTVVDENGVTTTFTYVGHQVASRTVAGNTWQYLWDNERLVGVGKPEGNWELRCFRTGGDVNCTGDWTGQLTSVLQAANSSGGDWVEMTQYSYWPDGTIHTQTDSVNDGGTPEVRRRWDFAADAHRRPTFSSIGTGGDFHTAAAFDGADNRIASGIPYNSPPAWCRATGGSDGSSGALSRLCAQFGYDRANRLRQLDLFKDAASNTPTRACIDYDTQGNVSRVTTGCGVSDSCSLEATPSTCGGNADYSHDYKTDDFGNVVEVKLSGTSNGAGGRGIFRYEYDARGNLTAEQTEAQRAANIRHVHTYDPLNRRTSSYEYWGSTAYGLAQWDYESSGASPGSYCTTPVNTSGRLRHVIDPAFQLWYQYDAEGRVVREIRTTAGDSSCLRQLDTIYTYNNNGNLTSIRYPYDRVVSYTYGTGGSRERVTSVSVNWFSGDGGTATRSLVTNVSWEPWGELRSYSLNVDGGATLQYDRGADQSGRMRGITVTQNGIQLYRKAYEWQGDFVTGESTFYGTSDAGIVMTYTYDNTGQLMSATNLTDSTTSGAYDSRQYSYNARGNIITQQVSNTPWTYMSVHDAGSVAQIDWTTYWGSDIWNGYAIAHDRDGRVSKLLGAPNSNDAGWQIEFDYISDWPSPGSGSVFRDVTITQPNGSQASYTYFYDSEHRRSVKAYPVNTVADFFFYDLGHQILTDATNPSSLFPVDDYIWLGGRPVATIRGNRKVLQAPAADGVNSCSRYSDGVACGVYFLVTDYLGKTVLSLDSSRRVTGVGEYDPYGQINRRSHIWQTGHPYAANVTTTDALAQQRTLGMNVDMRFHFPMVDVLDSCGRYDQLYIQKPSGGNYAWITGTASGDRWTNWLPTDTLDGGVAAMQFNWSSRSCTPKPMGVVAREYEYRRYETGATPYFPPLRFPGHYYDAETDLFENWHRNYSPSLAGYLQPEPLMSTPRSIHSASSMGVTPGSYSYALNNPIGKVDPDGNCPFCAAALACVGGACESAAAAAAAVTAALAAAASGAYCGLTGNCFPSTPETENPSPAVPRDEPICSAPPVVCPPCPVRKPRFDLVPPSAPHYPCLGNHTHWYTAHQAPPPSCACNYKEDVVCH